MSCIQFPLRRNDLHVKNIAMYEKDWDYNNRLVDSRNMFEISLIHDSRHVGFQIVMQISHGFADAGVVAVVVNTGTAILTRRCCFAWIFIRVDEGRDHC